MTREEIFEKASEGDDYVCPQTVVLTRDGKVVKTDDPEGFTVLRYAGETMSKKVADKLGLDKFFAVEPVAEVSEQVAQES